MTLIDLFDPRTRGVLPCHNISLVPAPSSSYHSAMHIIKLETVTGTHISWTRPLPSSDFQHRTHHISMTMHASVHKHRCVVVVALCKGSPECTPSQCPFADPKGTIFRTLCCSRICKKGFQNVPRFQHSNLKLKQSTRVSQFGNLALTALLL